MLDIMISTKLLYCMTPFSDYEKKRAAAEAFNNPMQSRSSKAGGPVKPMRKTRKNGLQ